MMRSTLSIVLVGLLGCGGGGGGGGSGDRDAGEPGGRDAGPTAARDSGGPGEPDAGRVSPGDAGPVMRSYELPPAGSYRYLCDVAPPAGTEAPDPLPTYAGTCPTLAFGREGRNTIMSSGAPRQFLLAVPTERMPGERLPVVFLWHPMGSEADTFFQDDYLQPAVDRYRFIAVLPESKDDLGVDFFGERIPWEWPWTRDDTMARVEEEARFLDDMLACVAEQLGVNEQCVATGGVSAGGLWQPVLAALRSRRLASFTSLSGGVDASSSYWARFAAGPWRGAEQRMPSLVVWGGPTDECLGFNFQESSMNLESAIAPEGHAVIECIHNCGHAAPPFDPGDPLLPVIDFFLNHPYWLAAGDTPYVRDGLPASFPEWCGLGAGSATVRTGACASESPCDRYGI